MTLRTGESTNPESLFPLANAAAAAAGWEMDVHGEKVIKQAGG